MRIYEQQKRLQHSLATINYYLENEYNYYKEYNQYPFPFGGVDYISLYRRLNVQVLVTKKCPFDCSFCVEKVNPVGIENRCEEKQLESLNEVIKTLKANGMAPTVSITGGEPTLYTPYLNTLATHLNKLNVAYNLNTAGVSDEPFTNFSRINLSVHSANVEENAAIFGAKRGNYWDNPNYEHATIQSVIQHADMSSLIDFIDTFKQKRYSLRFPALTADDESIEWQELFRAIEKDKNFTFIQQKIGDYYWFEEYSYKGKIIRFSFASLKQLAYYKATKPLEDRCVRAVVILPNGDVKFDWISTD